MKYNFLLLFLFIGSFGFGQYQPLLEEDKFWDVFFWFEESLTGIDDGIRIHIKDDTVINNINYKKLIGTGFQSDQSNVFVPPFTLSSSTGLVGIMREDTIEQKIYTIPLSNNPLNQEYLT